MSHSVPATVLAFGTACRRVRNRETLHLRRHAALVLAPPRSGLYPRGVSVPDALPPPTSAEDLELRARALETVLALARISATAEGLQALAAEAVAVVQAYTGCPAVCIFRYDEIRRVFLLLAQRGFDAGHFPPLSSALPAEGSLTGVAAVRRQTVMTSDIASDPRI